METKNSIKTLLSSADQEMKEVLNAKLRRIRNSYDKETFDAFKRIKTEHSASGILKSGVTVQKLWEAAADAATVAAHETIDACIESGVKDKDMITDFVIGDFKKLLNIAADTIVEKGDSSSTIIRSSLAQDAEERSHSLRVEVTIRLHDHTKEKAQIVENKKRISNRVFVVHGHDKAARLEIASLLKDQNLTPIILQEEPSKGSTIIEKLENESEKATYAIVLLTPDDLGRAEKDENLRPRARQNVILELGYCMGKLGRENVCALKIGDIEVPSDYQGMIWIDMDEPGAWKVPVLNELSEAGFSINLNALVKK